MAPSGGPMSCAVSAWRLQIRYVMFYMVETPIKRSRSKVGMHLGGRDPMLGRAVVFRILQIYRNLALCEHLGRGMLG